MAVSSRDQLCINTIRTLAIDTIQKANSGHPGLPLGAAPMAHVLWQDHLVHAPSHPDWPNRDRFVLSPGHGSALLYALLHLHGYDLPLEQLKNFRQWQALTPGHPEFGLTPGVECTTGPLGQGTANVVGMAIAEQILASIFNRPDFPIVDHFTYGLISDGDVMEGISAEAASLAGHLKLGKLICLYDANDVCLDGPTSMTFTEDVAARYASAGWHVQTVTDGDNDFDGIRDAISAAKQASDKPSLVVVRTTIGFGSPSKAGSAASHGSPLGVDEVRATKQALDWDPDASFLVPDAALQHFRLAGERGETARGQWEKLFDGYRAAHPDLAADWQQALEGKLPDGWDASFPAFETGSSVATRSASGKALNAIAAQVPFFLGGDADLSCSTKTAITDGGSFSAENRGGRNIHFGVREHAMGAIANGICYHRGLRPFVSTFFVFADYVRPAIRLAALSELPAIYVFTHDSIGVGEDGPTHQPVEHLMSLRCMPNVHVLRPCDANETNEAWRYAMRRKDGPSILVFSRQNLPVLDRDKVAAAADLQRGGYVLLDAKGGAPQVILIATGSEVHLALAAQQQLEGSGTAARVVSMPCWEAFEAQDQAYRDQVLPPSVTARVSVEAGTTFGWARYVGQGGASVGVDRFGASAPGDTLFDKYGFTVEQVVAKVRELL